MTVGAIARSVVVRQYQHKLAGISPESDAIEESERLFRKQGFRDEQISVIKPDELLQTQQHKIESESNGVRDEFVRDISIGTGVGGVAGAFGATGIGLGLPALFVSAPIVAPLMVFGYAATIGGVAGAIVGLHVKEDVLTSVVEDALHKGYPVLMVHARDKQEAKQAHELMQSTMPVETMSI